MIFTLKHAPLNFAGERIKKVVRGEVLTFSRFNIDKILHLLNESDRDYVLKNKWATIYYIKRPLESEKLSVRSNWNKIVDVRYGSEIRDFENDMMDRAFGMRGEFGYESFKFLIFKT